MTPNKLLLEYFYRIFSRYPSLVWSHHLLLLRRHDDGPHQMLLLLQPSHRRSSPCNHFTNLQRIVVGRIHLRRFRFRKWLRGLLRCHDRQPSRVRRCKQPSACRGFQEKAIFNPAVARAGDDERRRVGHLDDHHLHWRLFSRRCGIGHCHPRARPRFPRHLHLHLEHGERPLRWPRNTKQAWRGLILHKVVQQHCEDWSSGPDSVFTWRCYQIHDQKPPRYT